LRLARRFAVGLVGAGVLVAAAATPAAAELSGPCTATARFTKSGVTVDAEKTDGPVVVEPQDEVRYTGIVNFGVDVEPRAVSGRIEIDLPFPLPDYSPGEWQGSDVVKGQRKGRYRYDLPTIAPPGVDVEVTGFHEDATASRRCEGSVTLRIAGGFFDSPAGPASLVLTILCASGLLIAARPKTVWR
jgi:hypothetical protein